MNEKTTLKGFRNPRLSSELKESITKDKLVRLNIDIEQNKLQQFKLYLVKNNKTMKEVLTNYIDSIIINT